MNNDVLSGRDFSPEFRFTASRSSGPGGQHVNKVSTRVELRFDVVNSKLLSQEEKEVILIKEPGKINTEGILIIVSQVERSQLKNKERTIEKFYALLTKALKPTKKRKPTRPSLASKEKRLETKRLQSEKKTRRKTWDVGRGTKDEGRRTKDVGRRTWDEGRRTKDEGRGTRDEGRRKQICNRKSTIVNRK